MNATEILIWLVPIMFAWAILSVLYWSIVRPILHDTILFRLYRKRDKIRSLVINGNISGNSFSYLFLEKWLSQTAYESPDITLCNFFRFCINVESKEEPQYLEQFSSEATHEMNEILSESVKDVILMMLANSPIVAIGGIVILFLMSLHHNINGLVTRFFEVKIEGCQTQPATAFI